MFIAIKPNFRSHLSAFAAMCSISNTTPLHCLLLVPSNVHSQATPI